MGASAGFSHQFFVVDCPPETIRFWVLSSKLAVQNSWKFLLNMFMDKLRSMARNTQREIDLSGKPIVWASAKNRCGVFS